MDSDILRMMRTCRELRALYAHTLSLILDAMPWPMVMGLTVVVVEPKVPDPGNFIFCFVFGASLLFHQ